jgi:hypothetical protein
MTKTAAPAGKKARSTGRGRSALYVYCLVHARRPPDLTGAPAGIGGSNGSRAIDAGRSLWLVAGEAPLALYSERAIEKGLKSLEWVSKVALAHEGMIEHVMASGTVVPMKMLTLFAGEENALAHVQSIRPRLERLVARLAGRVELGVRLWFEPAGVTIAREVVSGNAGAQFLMAKKRRRDAEREARFLAHTRAQEIFDELETLADDATRRTVPIGPTTGKLLLDGAFLVRATAEKKFRSSIDRMQKKLSSRGLELDLTGPWPPIISWR